MVLNDRQLGVLRGAAPRRGGFTLIELLVVLGILTLLAALTFGGLMVLPERARVRGTRALLLKADSALQKKLALFETRKQSSAPLAADMLLAGGDANRARVIMVARMMRQEFPELFFVDANRLTDGLDNDNDGLIDDPLDPDEDLAGQWLVDVDGNGVSDTPFSRLPNTALAYHEYVLRAVNTVNDDGRSFIAVHRPITTRAECLYMILAGINEGGLSEGAGFTEDEVADTDRDGLLEIVDKWGNPVQFFLWPSYFNSPIQRPGEEVDPDDRMQHLTDAAWWGTPLLRNNFERSLRTVTHFQPNAGSAQPKGFRTYPLIVSAGSDGGYGFRCVNDSAAHQYFGGSIAFTSPPEGDDNVMGTLDDNCPTGLMLSVGADGVAGTGDDGDPLISPAMVINDTAVEGFGMDQDNVDNHRLRSN